MNRRAALILSAVALLCLLVAGFLAPGPLARVAVKLPDRQGQLVASVVIDLDQRLCLKYIHSVERTPVEGWFAPAEEGGFRALKTKTTGTGTGLPNVVADDRVKTEGRWLIVDEQGRYLPEIPFYYLPLNQLRILVGERELDLGDVPPGSRLRITSEPQPVWHWLVAKLLPGRDKPGGEE